MEFTQPLEVGLGLAVRINNQYSHPVCMGRCTDFYATINDKQEISQETSYLLRNVDAGIWEFAGTGYHVNDMEMMQTIESQLMTSSGSCTKQLHKSIAQINCTNNRILSKVQKSFWSCTHVNSFQKYALYVNLHILLNI